MNARAFLAGSCTGGVMLGAALALYVGSPEPKFNGVTADEALHQITARNDVAKQGPGGMVDGGPVYGDPDKTSDGARVQLASY